MRIFKDIDFVEQLGSGMKRIMKYYDESIFKITDNFMIVTFPFNTNEIKDIYTPGDYYDNLKSKEKRTRNAQEECTRKYDIRILF